MPEDDSKEQQPAPAPARRVEAGAVAARPDPRNDGRLRPEHLYKAAGLAFLLALAFHFFDVLSQTFLLAYAAAILAVALNALVRRLPLTRKWVAALVGVVVIGGVAAFLWLGVPALLNQAKGLAGTAPAMEEQFKEWEQAIREQTGLNVRFPRRPAEKVGEAMGGQGGGQVLGRAMSVLEALFVPIIIFFGALFALADPNNRLLNPLLRIVPRHLRPAFYRIFQLLGERLLGWLKGTLVAMLAVGILSVALYSLIGIPNALLLGLAAGLLEFIPLVGPWTAGIAATMVGFLDDPTKGMWAAVAALAIQQIEANIITPWAMSRQAEIHPFLTLFALVLFGGLFGFLGLLLALPLTLLVWTVVQVLWVERAIDTDEDRIAPVVRE